MEQALYAGTFDPFTIGHQEIVEKGLKIFSKITLLLAVSPNKKPMFDRDSRKAMLDGLFADEPRIETKAWDGLVVDFAKKHQIHNIIRGLRPTGDFEVEFQMASMNKHLYPGLETLFFPTGEKTYFVSSTLVREVFSHGGDVEGFVPPHIYQFMQKFRQKG